MVSKYRIPRSRLAAYLVILMVLVGIALSGCDVALLFGSDDDWDRSTDPTLLAVTSPAIRSTYNLGEKLAVTWIGTLAADSVAIDLHHGEVWIETINATAPNTGEYTYVIPADLDTGGGPTNTYRISVRGRHLTHEPGELEVIAYSEYFTIGEPVIGGLTDVTVNQRLIVITVIDNGSEIDGDTVDIVLNGTPVVAGHVLVASPGNNFGLSLQQGDNVLEIVAINEGSVSPNTAQLLISNVVTGHSSQAWRLFTGEIGSLTITAP